MRKTGKPLNQIIHENMKLVKDMKFSEMVDKSSGLPDDLTDEELENIKEEIKLISRDFYSLEEEISKLHKTGLQTVTFEGIADCLSALLLGWQRGKKLIMPIYYVGSKTEQELHIGDFVPEVAEENDGDGMWLVAYTHDDQIINQQESVLMGVDVDGIMKVAYEYDYKGLLINPETEELILPKDLLEICLMATENVKEDDNYGVC